MKTKGSVAAPADETGRNQSWGKIAVLLADRLAGNEFPRGDLAELRRMDPATPNAAVFWRLMARHDLPASTNWENRWALILHGIALMTHRTSSTTSAHKEDIPVGRALFQGGASNRRESFYSEARLGRLLAARGAMLHTLLIRTFRMLAAAHQCFNWDEMAQFILADGHDESRAERARRKIAREYYRAQWHSEQATADSQP